MAKGLGEQIIDVGSRVTFPLGGHQVFATVVENRGFVGLSGRQILRVRLEPPDTKPVEFEPVEFEVPAAAVRKIAA